MAEGLKACPWCERTDYLLCSETSTDESYAKHQILARIVCTNPIHNGCIDGPAVVTAQPFVDPMKPAPEAIIAWNTRLPPPWRPDREAVARIIDPELDAHLENQNLAKCRALVAMAYGRADEILALHPPTDIRHLTSAERAWGEDTAAEMVARSPTEDRGDAK